MCEHISQCPLANENINELGRIQKQFSASVANLAMHEHWQFSLIYFFFVLRYVKTECRSLWSPVRP